MYRGLKNNKQSSCEKFSRHFRNVQQESVGYGYVWVVFPITFMPGFTKQEISPVSHNSLFQNYIKPFTNTTCVK